MSAAALDYIFAGILTTTTTVSRTWAIHVRPCLSAASCAAPSCRRCRCVFAECRFRVGIDLNPVDLRDPIERRWFEALIWPEHEGRRRLAAAAIDELLRDPPTIVRGNAVEVLAAELAAVPSDAALVVYNSAALCQGGDAEKKAIADVLMAFSSRRPIHWLYCEGHEVLLRALDRGAMIETKLANKDGHGRWLEWL